jgi:hypothetical protein
LGGMLSGIWKLSVISQNTIDRWATVGKVQERVCFEDFGHPLFSARFPIPAIGSEPQNAESPLSPHSQT